MMRQKLRSSRKAEDGGQPGNEDKYEAVQLF